MTRTARRGSGFTLIELLVVVAIIALLISILLPSLSRARAAARTIRCQANLKEFGNAHHMYANEAEDWFVPVEISGFGGWYRWIKWRAIMGLAPGDNWPEGLVCPEVPRDRLGIVQFNVGVNGTTGGPGLAAETNMPWNAGDRSTTLSNPGMGNLLRIFRGKVRSPSTKLYMADGGAWRISRAAANYPIPWDLFPELNPNTPAFPGGFIHQTSYRHNEGANVQMFDGHVEYRPKNEVFYFAADGVTPQGAKTDDLWFAYK